ncbi:MAG: hypothetical protein IKZ62_05065 [Prevotella sp.]|nr:hypothetical protein [Prevotella sp.]
MEDNMNFEEMRNQFAILKDQLNKQEIVSDHLLRETMKAKKSAINSTKRFEYICVAICLVLYPLLGFDNTINPAFIIATCLMVIVSAVATHYIHKPVDDLNFLRDDFTTVARVMAKFKKQYNQWLYYVTPALIIPWLCWTCYEFAWKNALEGVNPWFMTSALIVGVIIGFLIGYYYHRKAVNAAQEIMDQIEEIE